jgi:enoyl-CoA hydratase/carnithine racemase
LDLYSHNSVAVLAFSPDEGLPRLTRRLLREISKGLALIRRDQIFRGVVMTSGADSFAAGADLEEVSQLRGEEARCFARLGQALGNEIERCPIPVVAAIRGYCLGGALDLALACHARVATYDASLSFPGASLGLITGWGGTQRLPRLVGRSQAFQLLLTGERIPATQALTLGLVDELVPAVDLIDSAALWVQRVATRFRVQPAVSENSPSGPLA